AMGGSASEEFLAEADTGEDTFVRSTESGYAANVEAVTTPAPPELPLDGLPPAQILHTPATPTIDTLVDHLNAAGLGRTFSATDTLKNVMIKTRPPGTQDCWALLGIGVPGDREIDMKRLAAAVYPAEIALLDDADLAAHQFLVKGYIGPRALAANGVRYLVDPRVVPGTAWATGADRPDHHVVDLLCGRDFFPDGTIEAAQVRPGDPSPDGAGTLVAARGIEIGHIFQLGRKFADAFGLDALGPDGKPIRITMGSYGIGISRLVGAIAEQSHDARGLIWPREVAPADVHVVIAGKDGTVCAAGERLAAELNGSGLRVILDDRIATPGVKFTDAELIGVPTILVVGRGLSSGVVEVKDRATGERTEVPVDAVVRQLVELCRRYRHAGVTSD
ncbi:MAG: His/Gly/Thr/Pro-type tRNA ligase C-terminal domain-containing protein, partial [Pseudonocardiaceae bacterium]